MTVIEVPAERAIARGSVVAGCCWAVASFGLWLVGLHSAVVWVAYVVLNAPAVLLYVPISVVLSVVADPAFRLPGVTGPAWLAMAPAALVVAALQAFLIECARCRLRRRRPSEDPAHH